MPKVNLTMNKWGIVLKAIRFYKDEAPTIDHQKVLEIEDSIIDLAFKEAKKVPKLKEPFTKKGKKTKIKKKVKKKTKNV